MYWYIYIYNNDYGLAIYICKNDYGLAVTQETYLMGLSDYLCIFSASGARLIGNVLYIELQADITNQQIRPLSS
jgi:hypothetical protein